MTRTPNIVDQVNVARFPHIGISAAEVDLMIVQHGNAGEYRRGIHCPCVRTDTQQPDASCPVCLGLGRTYPEVLREPMFALDVKRNADLKRMGAGLAEHGTVSLTFPSDLLPGTGDMWLPDNDEHVVSETLTRNATLRTTDADVIAYRTAPDQVRQPMRGRAERLLYGKPCCIEDVSYLGGRGDERKLISASPGEYRIDSDGRWTWLADFGPTPGHAWTVRYRAAAVYVVATASPMFRHTQDRRMPHNVVAARLDKVSHEDLR